MKKLLIVIAGCLMAGLLLAMGVNQEVGIGSVHGRVVMTENGQPLGDVLVVLTRAADEHTFTDRNWHTRTKPDGTFSLKNIPAGDYEVEADASEHALRDTLISVAEGGSTPVDVRLQPNDPRLELESSRKVLAPGETVKIDAEGFLPKAKSFTVAVYRLSLEQIAAKGGVDQVLQPIGRWIEKKKDYSHLGKVVWSNDQAIGKRDVEGAFINPVKLPDLGEGLFVVHCSSLGLDSNAFLNISRIAMVTKSWSGGVLCYVTDLVSGKPVPGAQLERKAKVGLTECGHTDTQGLAKLPATSQSGADMLLARLGGSVAACNFAGPGNNSGDDDGDGKSDPNTRVFSYADRPIYRPGDTVQFKAVVRHLENDRLVLPKPGQATVRIYDPQENLLQVEHLPMSDHGTLHGTYTSSKEATPGVYRIDISADGGKVSYYANLAAYRKPDYSIKVTPGADRYTMGDQAAATVECQYFFGGPVVGAKVSARIYRNPSWDDWSDEEDEGNTDQEADQSEEGGFVGGEYVQEVEGVTDGTGKAVLKFSTLGDTSDDSSSSDSSDSSNSDNPKLHLYDYDYSVQVSVEESDTASFQGSTSMLVSRGDYRLTASTDPFIATAGQKASLTVSATSYDKDPKPVAGRNLQVQIGRETYTRHTMVFEPLQTLNVATGADGKAVVPLDVEKEENLRILVSSKDDRQRQIQAQTWLYVEGSPMESIDDQSKLTLKLDKKTYTAGDTAKILVATNSPGGEALLTVQADSVMQYRLVDLSKGSSIVHLPVDKSMAPNVYVTVAYVRKRTYVETSRNLHCTRMDRKLNIALTPSTTKALPGSTVSIRVKTTDRSGQGVPADLSLGVVDESIYAIRRDTTNIAAALYPQRGDSVTSTYSFPDIYLDGGDKAGGNIPIRRKFRDTAQWNPEVVTDASGNATCQVTLPDNLTSWRATAVGATDDTVVGMATTNIRASKPLMVRLLTPQFLVAQDQQQMTASVTNDSGAALDVDFRIRATGLTVGESGVKRIHLEQAQTTNIPLDVQAPGVSGDGDMVAEVRADQGQTDAVDGKLPVLPHGRLVVDHSSGVMGPATTVSLNALPNRDKGSGGLDVTVTPGVASAMLQSVDSLVQYPYGCVEQTMDRFLPAILVTHAIQGTPFDNKTLDARAVKIAADGFQRLIKMQHSDGGWGWWNYDDSSPFMTAYVLDGLAQAKAIGYNPPGNLNMEKALHWAADRLQKPDKNDDSRELQFLALGAAENGKLEQPKAILNKIDLRKADTGDVAVACMLAQAVHEPQILSDSLAKLRDLVEKDQFFNDMHDIWTADEGRALSLAALAHLDPKDPLIPSLLNQLNKDRGCFGWYSTRETSLVLESMCSYLKANPETVAPSDVSISLNGKLLRTVHVVPGAVDIPDLQISVPIGDLQAGKNVLKLTAKGGTPYYSVQLRQYDVANELPQVLQQADIQVTRSYHLMEPKKMPDGTMSLEPVPTPISSARNGDVIRCEISVKSTHPVSYVMVEDPIPSNCQVTDREEVDDDTEWTNWWASLVIRDDRVSLFADQVPAGTHKFTYMMRAQGTGKSDALPTYLEDMYRPSISASGAATPLTVNP